MSEFAFESLPLIERFADLADPSSYHEPPGDWWLIVTDVEGSTAAIESGRYKDVNILGAASIVAARNAAPEHELAFAFGGDGATILVPASCKDAVAECLVGLSALAESAYGLGLRVGGVPVSAILDRGAPVGVARFNLDVGAELAMFWGDGVSLAEEMVKTDPDRWGFELAGKEPDLGGLHCRWKPIPARNGAILSVLVKAIETDPAARTELYRELFDRVDRLGINDSGRPVDTDRLALQTNDIDRETEARLLSAGSGLIRKLHAPIVKFTNEVGSMLMKRKWAFGGFDGAAYAASLVSRTDFRKFDDALRMVVDVDDTQRAGLENLLKDLRAAGRIAYGIHLSNKALMTCLVDDYEEHHLHFIDGADGGYALAAKGLKRQLRQDAEACDT